ncbi:MAG: hypothetical protein M3Y91_02860 [Actinomycetota bacterium]|nr:hypothetical protein [Actinomycetota bacterium]
MTTHPSVPVRRIVIVHGPADDQLVEVLTTSGLEVAVDTGKLTIWAPVLANPKSEADGPVEGSAPARA